MKNEFSIYKNEFDIPLNEIIDIGYTPKKQRRFYLLNKLVGNHLEVKPNVIKTVGAIFAEFIYASNIFNRNLLSSYIKSQYFDEETINQELQKYIDPNEKVFILGLSESATAIGMATAAAIKDSFYIATSRENPIQINSLFEFEEEHTLITKHKCYLQDANILKNSDRVIIVEDEITTGNTMINLLKKLVSLSNAKKFNIVSILDFSNQTFKNKLKEFEKNNQIKIELKSLLQATMDYEKLNNIEITSEVVENTLEETTPILEMNIFDKGKYKLNTNGDIEIAKASGVLGCTFRSIREIEEKAKEISKKIMCNPNSKVLVIGHSENMYLPSRIGYYINKNCLFKSTTKSLILAQNKSNYSINERSRFAVDGCDYYLYNKKSIENKYDKVFYIIDTNINVKLTNNSTTIKI